MVYFFFLNDIIIIVKGSRSNNMIDQKTIKKEAKKI